MYTTGVVEDGGVLWRAATSGVAGKKGATAAVVLIGLFWCVAAAVV